MNRKIIFVICLVFISAVFSKKSDFISADEIKDGEASAGLESQNGITANKSSRVYNGPSFEDLSRAYNSSLKLPSKKRSPNKIWNAFQSATSRYNSFCSS